MSYPPTPWHRFRDAMAYLRRCGWGMAIIYRDGRKVYAVGLASPAQANLKAQNDNNQDPGRTA